MFKDSIPLFCCPRCRSGPLSTSEGCDAPDVLFGFVSCPSCQARFPILSGVLILVSNPRNYVATHRSAVFESMLGADCTQQMEDYVRACAEDGCEFDKSEEPDESDCSAYLNSHYPSSITSDDTPITRFVDLLSTITDGYWTVLLREISKARSSGYLFDIGCSVGGVFHRTQTENDGWGGYLGCDLGFRGVHAARKRAISQNVQNHQHFEFIVADASELPFAQSKMSCLLASNMIDVTSSPSETIRRFCNAIPDGGRLIISTPWYWHSGVSSMDDPLWSRDSAQCLPALIDLVQGFSGFRVVDTHRDVPWPLTISDRHLRLFLCDVASFVRECQ